MQNDKWYILYWTFLLFVALLVFVFKVQNGLASIGNSLFYCYSNWESTVLFSVIQVGYNYRNNREKYVSVNASVDRAARLKPRYVKINYILNKNCVINNNN